MKYRIKIVGEGSYGFGWQFYDVNGEFWCDAHGFHKRDDAIADARRFAELLKVEVVIDG